ncbi:MAG: hypothetical protein Q9183_006640 [Haloplaca sp. 2 TL-2023]
MVRPLQSVRLTFSNPYMHQFTEILTIGYSLAPKYEELAEMYTSSHSPRITIAKVDATANDVPDEISGFPTIKLFPAGNKDSPITYSGSRTIEDLANFIKENGKYQIDVYEGQTASNETAEEEDEEEGMVGKAAEAATEKVKEKAKDAAEAVKTAATDGDHDEL